MKIATTVGGPSSVMTGNETGLSAFISTLPPWLITLMGTLAVLLVAALAGYLLGKVYCAARYPNPEKRSVLNVKQRFLFLGVLIIICAALISAFSSFTKDNAVSVGSKYNDKIKSSQGGVVTGKAYLG